MKGAGYLTDAKIAGLKSPESGHIEIGDTDVRGLRLRVSANGAKTFIVRKRAGSKIKVFTIGRYGVDVTLAKARAKARQVISDLEAGTEADKIRQARLGQRPALQTIDALWPVYEATLADKRSKGEIARIFTRYILPALGDRRADMVTRGDVTRFIDGIDRPVMARAVHSQLSAFYTWALPRLDNQPSNPCKDAGRPAKPKPRDRVLADDELVALWRECERQPLPWGVAIRLLILTGQRRSEVFEADRSEFDLGRALWTIPAERAKNGATHLVPLSKPAVGLLEGLGAGEGGGKLFPAKGNPDNGPSGITKAVLRIERAVAEALGRDVPHWTLHDLRRTVATGLQRLGIRLEVTEAVLNHISGSRGGIAGVYQRHDWAAEKRTALEAWADELDRKLSGAAPDNVVKLHV